MGGGERRQELDAGALSEVGRSVDEKSAVDVLKKPIRGDRPVLSSQNPLSSLFSKPPSIITRLSPVNHLEINLSNVRASRSRHMSTSAGLSSPAAESSGTNAGDTPSSPSSSLSSPPSSTTARAAAVGPFLCMDT